MSIGNDFIDPDTEESYLIIDPKEKGYWAFRRAEGRVGNGKYCSFYWMEQETKNFGPKTPEKIMELKKLGKLRKHEELTKEELKSMGERTDKPCCSDDCKDTICFIMLAIAVLVPCAGLVFLGYYLGGGFDKK